jgi:hypothetical protein
VLGTTQCFAPTQAQHGQRDGPRRQHDAHADCTDEHGQRREQHGEAQGKVEQPVRRARPSAATQLTGQLGIFATQAPLNARKESTFTRVHLTTIQVRTAGSTSVNGASPIGADVTLDLRQPLDDTTCPIRSRRSRRMQPHLR